jgi:RimJ/RimL family protein N-acetyltransferase
VDDEILTSRLRLRRWRADDLDALVEIFAQPEVWRYPFGRGFTAQETEAFLTRRIEAQDLPGASPAAAEDRETERLIGYVGLSVPVWLPEVMPAVEVGWRLDPPYWGRGLASEGARAALDYGFSQMGLSEVLSIYQPDNVASGRVMDRVGIGFDRETRHPTSDIVLRIHRVTRQEWERRQAH